MQLFNRKFIGIIISIALIAILLFQIDINKTFEAFTRVNVLILLPIIPVYILAFIVRAYRWRLFLYEEFPKINSLLSSLFIGYSANYLLPARAGELYRAYSFGKKESISKVKVLASIVLERLFDGFVLFLVLITLVSLLYSGDLFFNIALYTGITFLGGFVLLLSIVRLQDYGNKRNKIKKTVIRLIPKKFFSRNLITETEKKINYFFDCLNSFLDGLSVYNSPSLLVKSLFYTAITWVLEGSVVFLVIKSFGIEIPFTAALFTLTIVAFATLIPAGPAGIGPFQWGYIVALGFFNITKEVAFAVSIVNQFATIAIVLSIGIYYIWKDHINISEIEDQLKKEQQSLPA